MGRIYFLLPVYNEEKNIQRLCSDLDNLPFSNKYLVWVNDGSNDGSIKEISTYCKMPFFIINQPHNMGPGAAFEKGFEYILSQDVLPDDVVVTMETDNTADLNHLEQMIKQSKSNELVLASVYMPLGGFDQTNTFRLFISHLANCFVRIRFGLSQKTLTSFYRIYKISLLQKIYSKFGSFCREKGFICKIELLIKAKMLDAKIIEVPTILRSGRRQGKSKMKVIRTALECAKFCLSQNPSKRA